MLKLLAKTVPAGTVTAMLFTTHTAAGALLGQAARTPLRAAGAGVVSHLLMDTVAHWGARNEREFMTVAAADGLAALALAGRVITRVEPHERVRVVAGMAGAMLPDLDKPVKRLLGRRLFPRPVRWVLGVIQREDPTLFAREVTVAAGTSALALWVLTSRQRPGQTSMGS